MDEFSRRKRRTVLRWAAVVPTAFVLWYATLALVVALNSLLVSFCPARSLLGGFCTASWAHPAERAIAIGCAGLAALLVVAGAAWVAPAYRLRVALMLFIVGVLAAIYTAGHILAQPEFVAALLGGTLGMLVARAMPQQAPADGA